MIQSDISLQSKRFFLASLEKRKEFYAKLVSVVLVLFAWVCKEVLGLWALSLLQKHSIAFWFPACILAFLRQLGVHLLGTSVRSKLRFLWSFHFGRAEDWCLSVLTARPVNKTNHHSHFACIFHTQIHKYINLIYYRASTQISQRSLPDPPQSVARHDSGDTTSAIYAIVNVNEGNFNFKKFLRK